MKWNKDKLKQLYKDKQAREELKPLFNSYWDILHLTEGFNSSISKTLLSDLDYLNYFPFMEEYIGSALEKMSDILNIPPLENILVNQTTLDLTYAFYESLDIDLFTIFQTVFANNQDNIAFKTASIFDISNGYTYMCSSQNEVFIKILNSHNLQDVLTLIHEFGHAIFFIIKPNNQRNIVSNCYDEIEGLFLELLALDFLEHFPEYQQDVQTLRNTFYIDLFCELSILNNKYDIYHYGEDYSAYNDDFKPKAFLKEYRHIFGYSKRDIKQTLKLPAEKYLIYAYPRLIAIELYQLYHLNPKKALSLFKQIIMQDFSSEIEFDEYIKKMGIHPSSNINILKR